MGKNRELQYPPREDNITVGESALKVVVGEKKNYQGHISKQEVDRVAGVAYDLAIDKTLSTPLPPVEDCVEMIDLSEIVDYAVKRCLDSHRLSYTRDEEGDGMPLVDILTPNEDEDITRGREELIYLIENITYDVVNRIANSKSILSWKKEKE